MKIPPSHRIVEHGPSVGQHYGKDIPAYFVTADGKRHEYDRLAKCDADGGTPLDQLAANESVIAPGLIYREQTAERGA